MDFKHFKRLSHAVKTGPAFFVTTIVLFCLCNAGLSVYGSDFGPLCNICVSRWKQGEKIFHTDSRWLGGDGAASVDLGNGRVLWLFGDSFIDTTGSGTRRGSTLIRNSVAIQSGYDPSHASMVFTWRTKNGKPSAFFKGRDGTWFWPASGIMIKKHLLIFLFEARTAQNALGFETVGWKAVWVANPFAPPGRWTLTRLKSPQKQGLLVGSGRPIIENGFLYAFATDSRNRSVYLARWPEEKAAAGTLTMPQWWGGKKAGWLDHRTCKTNLAPLFTGGQTEFGVEYLRAQKRYVIIQTLSITNPCLAILNAPAITGPWSTPACFFRTPERDDPDLLIYAAKNHPSLHGADMIFTYMTNSTRTNRLLSDMAIYFPIMLKGHLCSRSP